MTGQTLIILMLLWNGVGEDNLLANPGFEQLDGAVPMHWRLFLQPSDYASAGLDQTDAFEGSFSARLSNSRAYEKEPANNWSQNIIQELGGERLRISGYIRTKACTEAALWLQCCRMRPWAVLKRFSSTDEAPCSGTRDWMPVEFVVDVPEGTDFLTLRCVMLGTGEAWFDDLKVVRDKPSIDVAIPPPVLSPTATQTENSELPSQPRSVDPVETPRLAPVTQPGPAASRESVDSESVAAARTYARTHRELLDRLSEMRETNQQLSDEVNRLREQLRRLEEEMRTLREPPAKEKPKAESTPAPSVVKVPPLVPHRSL